MEEKEETTTESRNSLFAVRPTIAIATPPAFPTALCKQIGLPHQLDGCLRNSIRVRWYGCSHETGNEWLRPRRNGSDMTHRHFPVSSRHSAVGANRECTGYSSIHARSVASFRVCTIPKKGGTFTPNELARSRRGYQESRLYPCTTNGARYFDVVQTPPEQVLYSDPTNETRFMALKTADCRLTSRELLRK